MMKRFWRITRQKRLDESTTHKLKFHGAYLAKKTGSLRFQMLFTHANFSQLKSLEMKKKKSSVGMRALLSVAI